MMLWFSATDAVLAIGGVALGVLLGNLTSPSKRKAKQLRLEIDRLLAEQEAYKASVNSHFRKTADLVGQMTRSYAAVYDHLAGGARQFCDDAGPETRVPFGPLPETLASPEIETEASEDAGPGEADAEGRAGSGKMEAAGEAGFGGTGAAGQPGSGETGDAGDAGSGHALEGNAAPDGEPEDASREGASIRF